MQIITQALVIKEMSVKENDRLLTLLTKDYGVIKAFAANAKSIKNKRAASTGLLTLSKMMLEKKGDTYRLRDAQPIKVFFGLGSDIKLLSLAQYFCELSLALAPAESPAPEFMRLILNSLHYLMENKRDINIIKAITELRISVLSGYAPDLLNCADCGKFEDDIMYFDMQNGGLFCSECKPENRVYTIDRTILNAMRHIVFSEFERLYSFEIPSTSAQVLSNLTEKYLITQCERKFYTLDFYHSIP